MSHETKPLFNTYGHKTNVYVNSENPPPYTEEKQKRTTTTIFGVRNDNVKTQHHQQQPAPPIIHHQQQPKQQFPKQQFNDIITKNATIPGDLPPRRVTLASRDSCSLPCSHYRPPDSEIKTWMFDGYRDWCPYCNPLTKGENLIRSGDKLSGLAKSTAASPWNRMDYDESSTSDLEMEGFNDSSNFHMNFPLVDFKDSNKEMNLMDNDEIVLKSKLQDFEDRKQKHPYSQVEYQLMNGGKNPQQRNLGPTDAAFWTHDANKQQQHQDEGSFFGDDRKHILSQRRNASANKHPPPYHPF